MSRSRRQRFIEDMTRFLGATRGGAHRRAASLVESVSTDSTPSSALLGRVVIDLSRAWSVELSRRRELEDRIRKLEVQLDRSRRRVRRTTAAPSAPDRPVRSDETGRRAPVKPTAFAASNESGNDKGAESLSASARRRLEAARDLLGRRGRLVRIRGGSVYVP